MVVPLHGSKTQLLTDFVVALDSQLSHREVTPLYLRPLAILVRPGNPRRIRAFEDLLRPGTSVLVSVYYLVLLIENSRLSS